MNKPVRTRIEDLRRRELIAAAYRVFMDRGLTGMTTARICEEAGMSPGILSYYFKGKDDVLFAVVRMNNRALVQDVVARLRQARTRWERLCAIIEGNFPEAYFHQNVASAWLSVCAASTQTPRYAQLQRVFHRRLASNLRATFGGAVPQPLADSLILMISTQIDGLWLRKVTDPELGRDLAVRLLLDTVESRLGPDLRQRLQDIA